MFVTVIVNGIAKNATVMQSVLGGEACCVFCAGFELSKKSGGSERNSVAKAEAGRV